MNEQTTCRCPVRPYAGGWARDSSQERAQLAQWEREHGQHAYAKARDELAKALQNAEGDAGGGEAVLDMVNDVFNLPRRGGRVTNGAQDVSPTGGRSMAGTTEAMRKDLGEACCRAFSGAGATPYEALSQEERERWEAAAEAAGEKFMEQEGLEFDPLSYQWRRSGVRGPAIGTKTTAA